jgi:hypothetical protein
MLEPNHQIIRSARECSLFRRIFHHPLTYEDSAMSQEALWQRVQQECPRRILGELHRRGEYRHGTTPRFPGKVLCCHEDAALPDGWIPTPAQEAAGQADEARQPAA